MKSVNLLPWREVRDRLRIRKLLTIGSVLLVFSIGLVVFRVVDYRLHVELAVDRKQLLESHLSRINREIVVVKDRLEKLSHLDNWLLETHHI